MTNLELAMRGEPAAIKQKMADFMAPMSHAARDLAERCPPCTKVYVGDEVFYVVGYSETNHPDHAHLLVSRVDPRVDFHAALKDPISFCPNKMSVFRHGELN